jgi:DNA-binding PadR family transcriptional regulator
MAKKSSDSLTTPDLVLLSLLAERPMHGYQANALLEFRQIRDWAAVSRPQVYYSLEKLQRLKFLKAADSDDPAAGPEKRVLATTAAGRAALADALERESWATERERPPFLTWMALSWQAGPGVFAKQLARRRQFLESEIAREEKTLADVIREVGHPHHEVVWMLTLTLQQMKTELRWLKKVDRESKRRQKARHPAYPDGNDSRNPGSRAR